MELVDALVLWLHIFAAVLFIGPQAFLFVAAVPAIRSVADAEARARALRVVTTRFAWLGGGALAVLLATGIWNYYEAEDAGFIDADDFPRYYFTLFTKLTLVMIVVMLTALHGAVFGRKLQQLQAAGAGEPEIAAVRRWSMATSVVNFGLSVVILLLASLLGSDWSKLS
ncbi:MAG: CopD family protein [Dehalococcoidia bacterium]